jgi:hypothetical protein
MRKYVNINHMGLIKILRILLFVLATGCNSLSLRYEADIETDKGMAHYTFDETVKTHWQAAGCGITAIFYGGFCWRYFGEPFSGARSEISADAEKTIREKYQITKYEIKTDSIKKLGWFSAPTRSNFVLTPAVQPVTAPLTSNRAQP